MSTACIAYRNREEEYDQLRRVVYEGWSRGTRLGPDRYAKVDRDRFLVELYRSRDGQFLVALYIRCDSRASEGPKRKLEESSSFALALRSPGANRSVIVARDGTMTLLVDGAAVRSENKYLRHLRRVLRERADGAREDGSFRRD